MVKKIYLVQIPFTVRLKRNLILKLLGTKFTVTPLSSSYSLTEI